MILEPVEELLLMKVSVFPSSGEISMSYHFTHTTPNECKHSLLTIVQGLCFASDFSQKAL
jgi:hypothetical protein